MTGFEPFFRWSVNSSWVAVTGYAARSMERPEAVCLPVEHRLAAERVQALVRQQRPAALLLVGLADRPVPTLECWARPGVLAPHAGGVRIARWGMGAALAAAQRAGLPLRLSVDAGRYVCETTFWLALGLPVPRVAFLHVPPLRRAWPPARLSRLVAAVLAGAKPR